MTTTDQPGPSTDARMLAATLSIRDLRDLLVELTDAIPTAPDDLRAGYQGALRVVTDEIVRRKGSTDPDPGPVTGTDSEGNPWGQTVTLEACVGIEVEQSLRAAALHAASAYLSGRPQELATSYRDQLCDLAESLMPWLRTGERS